MLTLSDAYCANILMKSQDREIVRKVTSIYNSNDNTLRIENDGHEKTAEIMDIVDLFSLVEVNLCYFQDS